VLQKQPRTIENPWKTDETWWSSTEASWNSMTWDIEDCNKLRARSCDGMFRPKACEVCEAPRNAQNEIWSPSSWTIWTHLEMKPDRIIWIKLKRIVEQQWRDVKSQEQSKICFWGSDWPAYEAYVIVSMFPFSAVFCLRLAAAGPPPCAPSAEPEPWAMPCRNQLSKPKKRVKCVKYVSTKWNQCELSWSLENPFGVPFLKKFELEKSLQNQMPTSQAIHAMTTLWCTWL